MPEIRLEHITKRWGKFYGVDDLNLVIENNAFVTLLGPSGCGKTTTLRMIAGLETPTSGRITIGDTVVFDSELGINIPANKRKVGFLFQNYALWPNMTVYQNISFGLSNIKEEMPKISFEAKNAARLAQILKNPQDVVKTLEECRDKSGKLDEKKAIIKLIDTYTISQYTAQKLFGYHLEQGKDVSAEVKALEEKVEAARKAQPFNENFELLKDGKGGNCCAQADQRRDRPVRAPGVPHRQNQYVHGPLSRGAVRRSAAACGHRPDAGSRTQRAVHGRAAFQSGCQTASGNAL